MSFVLKTAVRFSASFLNSLLPDPWRVGARFSAQALSLLAPLVLLGMVSFSSPAQAQMTEHQPDEARSDGARGNLHEGAAAHRDAVRGAHGHSSGEVGAHEADQNGEHGGGAHGHVPEFSDINWFYGLLAEREGPPSLLFRPPGMPVPLGALIFNSLLLFYLLWRFGGPALRRGLVSRKERIAGEIQAAAKMKEEAEKQLQHYEQKLHHMSVELERIMKEMREQAEAEHARILAEAKSRREAMEQEALDIVAHELVQARQEAVRALVARSVKAAAVRIEKDLQDEDQNRLADILVRNVEKQLANREVRS